LPVGVGHTDQAAHLLSAALRDISLGGAHYLRAQIELWLADLYLERNEYGRAETHLAADQLAERIHSSRQKPENHLAKG